MGGSSKKVTVGYKYHVGMHMALCHGPVDQLDQIRVDGRVAWAGISDGGRIVIDAPDLMGGEKREGGVSGNVDLAMGQPGQGKNDYLQGQLGADIPAFRGVVSAILRQVYVGTNPYLKKWLFRCRRIYKSQNGAEQWYPGKAAIIVSPETVFYEDLAFPATSADYEGKAGVTINSGFDSDDLIIVTKEKGMTYQAWSPWDSDDDPNAGGKPWYNKFEVTDGEGNTSSYWGPERYATAEEAEDAVVGNAIILTGSDEYTFWLEDDSPSDNRGGLSIKIFKNGHLDMNPAHIIRECLTDPDWGMGYLVADIDDNALMAAADTLHDESMGISILWDRQMPLEEFISEILKHINGNLYTDRTTGKFVLSLIRDDYSVENLPVFDETNVMSVSNASRPAIGELVNSVTVNYWDSETGETASVTAQDQALMQMQGSAVNTTVQYPGFTNQPIASRIALRDLKSLSTQLLSCDITANREAANLNIGDPFVLDWPDLGINSSVMRVQGLELGDGKRGQIKITAVEDVFATPDTGLISRPEDDLWQDPTSVQPLPSDPRLATELPYYELVISQGQAAADDILTDDPGAGFLLATGGRQGNEINASLYVDSGSGSEDSGVMDFSPYGYLLEDIGPTDTIIYLTEGKDLDQVDAGTIAAIGDELIRLDSIGSDSNGDYASVGRGVLDTTPAEHLAGSAPQAMLFWGNFLSSDEVQYTVTEQIDVQLLTTTGNAILSSIDAPTDTVIMNSRASRPYPPGDFRIDGLSYPVEYSSNDPVTLSWTHRDRTQQTSGTVYDHTAGDIGPEMGVTYRVEADARLADDSVIANFISENVGTDTSFVALDSSTPPPENTIEVTFRVFSLRDGYDSWQPATWIVKLLQAPFGLTAEYREFAAPSELTATYEA